MTIDLKVNFWSRFGSVDLNQLGPRPSNGGVNEPGVFLGPQFTPLFEGSGFKVADLSPKNIFGNKAATDGTKLDLNRVFSIGETRVWRLDSGPNLQP